MNLVLGLKNTRLSLASSVISSRFIMYKTLNFLFCIIDKIECNTGSLRRINELAHVICVTGTVLDPVKYNNLQILHCVYSKFFFFSHLKYLCGEFSDGPVVRTLHFDCRGHGFDPWSKN